MSEQMALFDPAETHRLQAQAIFNRVARHLFAQGRQSLCEGDVCAYRGDGGTRCAVGVLITDEEYHPRMEGHDVNALMREARGVHHDTNPSRWPTLQRLFPYSGLLMALQGVHDHMDLWGDTGEMRRRLRRVANEHQLDAELLEDLSFGDQP
jgi:hypothetical protein